MQNILLLDNYDSFTYNLVHYFEAITGTKPIVKRNNEISIEAIADFDAIVLSPGPGLPKDAGIMPELLQKYSATKKILGVCLGHQAIAEHFGAQLTQLEQVQHGVASQLSVLKSDCLYKNIPATFKVARYHSWVVDNSNLPACLEVLAIDEQKQIMSLKHKTLPVWGVQFHPESILSEHGMEILGNWLEL